jgi:hypothetical protein
MGLKLTKSHSENDLTAGLFCWYDFIEVTLEIIGSYNLSKSQHRVFYHFFLYKNGDRSDT